MSFSMADNTSGSMLRACPCMSVSVYLAGLTYLVLKMIGTVAEDRRSTESMESSQSHFQGESSSLKENAIRGSQDTQENVQARPGTTNSHRPPQTTRFSCRRWRRLTGKGPNGEDIGPLMTTTIARPPPPHWSSSMATSGFISAFPSSSSSSIKQSSSLPVAKSPRGNSKSSLQWKEIDRFDSQVMKQLVDTAYGTLNTTTTTSQSRSSHPYPHNLNKKHQRKVYKELVHNQVYLPSVHRPLDYLETVRAAATRPATTTSKPPRPKPEPARLGAKLLSTQLQDLQAELLDHYEADRSSSRRDRSPMYESNKIWSPQPPRPRQPPSSSPSPSSSSTSFTPAVSYRSQRHKPASSVNDCEDATDQEDENDEEEEALVFTDSDTYSLSSGVEQEELESEMDEPLRHHHSDEGAESAVAAFDTSSWCSLESHVLDVLDALEGCDATHVGSLREPLVMAYDSDDFALLADTCSEKSACSGRLGSASSTASLQILGSGDEEDVSRSSSPLEEHVVFLDNGVRVNSSGQAVAHGNELVMALASIRMDDKRDVLPTADSIVDGGEVQLVDL